MPVGNGDANANSSVGGAQALQVWLKRVFHSENVGAFSWGITADHHTWTDEFQALYGLEPGKVAAHPDVWLGRIHPADRSDLEADVVRATDTGEAFEREFRIIRADGETRWMHARCVLERDETGTLRRLVGVNVDITERKEVEAALDESEAQFHRVRAAELIGAYVADYATGIVRLSPALTEMLGLKGDTALSADLLNLTHPMDASDILNALARARDPSGAGQALAEGRVRCADGHVRWLALSGRVFFDGAVNSPGAPRRQVGLVIDLTQRRSIESKLAASEAAQRAILDTVPDAIIEVDEHGVIRSINAGAIRTFGYSMAEAIGRNVSMFMTPEHRDAHDGYIARYLETGVAKIIGSSRQVTARRKDATVFPAELYIGEIRNREERTFVGFVRDLSDRTRAEETLRAAQADLFHAARVSEMGEMAAAIAHELNQPLAAATNFLNAARRYLEQGDSAIGARDALTQAAAEQVRAGQILQRMRKFLTKSDQERRREPLNLLVREAVRWAMVSAPRESVDVQFNLAAEIGDVFVDRIQVQQVVLNLLRNSFEAMATNQPEQPRTIVVTTRNAGPKFALVSIEDTGPGIDPSFTPRLFDAFATTKKEGMGVGLRICKTIIESHGGHMSGANKSNGGACFEFTIPLA